MCSFKFLLIFSLFFQAALGVSVATNEPCSSEACVAQPSRPSKVSREGPVLKIEWDDQTESRYHLVWLRDNCPGLLDPVSFQKTRQSDDIPDEVHSGDHTIEVNDKGELVITWAFDQHVSTFTPEFLHRFDYSKAQETRGVPRHILDERITWGSEMTKAVPTLNYTEVMTKDEAFYEWLLNLQKYGICILRGAPLEDGTVDETARRIAYIRETLYPHPWNVVHKPDAENVAYTTTRLLPHTDLMYYEAPPGIQFLHCMRNDGEVKGGENWFVDGFKVVEELEKIDPKAVEVLKRVPVTHHYKYGNFRQRFRRATIGVNSVGALHEVCLSPPWEAPLQTTFEDVLPFYEARKLFYGLVNSSALHIMFPPKVGDIVTFDNRRLMHARASYSEPTPGQRHLQGTYVDRDEFESKLRYLHEKLHKDAVM